MARSRLKMKGRRESGSFIILPQAVINDPNFIALSPYAVKLLIDLYGQYKGFNNGDFCAAWSIMSKRGWRSKATLSKSIKELLKSNMIMVTRQGGRKVATLYAVTFRSIDECKGKLDVASGPAPGTWRTSRSMTIKPLIESTPKPPIESSIKPIKHTTEKLKSLPHEKNSIHKSAPHSELTNYSNSLH